MDLTVTAPRRLRRLAVAALAGVAAVGVVPSAAHAQTAAPPAPQPLDDVCAAVPDPYEPFDDVGDDHTFAEAVRCMAAADVTFGVRPGEYAPAAPVTRGQMASFLARTLDLAVALDAGDDDLAPLPSGEGTPLFGDVDPHSVHAESIKRLVAAGITEGGPGSLPATSYGPTRPVTRGQMASFVNRSLEHLTGTARTSDADFFADDEGDVHEGNINAVAAAGIAVGDGDDRFRPTDALTRGQMSAYIMRSLADLEADGAIGPVPTPLPTSVSVSDDAITAQDGDVLLAIGSLPDTVSPDGDIEFGGPVRFTDAALSDDGRWLAIGTIGAAHGHGWLHDVVRRESHLVDFAFEGQISAAGWSPDDRFALFAIESAASTDLLKLVDRDDLAPVADDTGFRVRLDEEDDLEPPYRYEVTGWEAPHTLCVDLEGTAACIDAETGAVSPVEP